MKILEKIKEGSGTRQTLLAQLIDPDKIKGFDHLADTVARAVACELDFIFFGGSLVTSVSEFNYIKTIKELCNIPVVLFPSSPSQVDSHADGILFLSLISGRNPEFLIGHHVVAAPQIKAAGLEAIATGYMLIDSGRQTTAQYMSNSAPIPRDKPEIAATTAIAAELLGMHCVYLDGGSGAEETVPTEMIRKVKSQVDIPIIVGGGIVSSERALALAEAGADVLVIGNGAEENHHLISELCQIMR